MLNILLGIHLWEEINNSVLNIKLKACESFKCRSQTTSGGQDRSNGSGIHYHIDDSYSNGTWSDYLGKKHIYRRGGAWDYGLDIKQWKRRLGESSCQSREKSMWPRKPSSDSVLQRNECSSVWNLLSQVRKGKRKECGHFEDSDFRGWWGSLTGEGWVLRWADKWRATRDHSSKKCCCPGDGGVRQKCWKDCFFLLLWRKSKVWFKGKNRKRKNII